MKPPRPHGARRRLWPAGFIAVLIAWSSAGCAGVPIEDLIRSLPLPTETRSRETVPGTVLGHRLVEVHWQHPAPASVERFKIYWGVEPGIYLAVEEVMPAGQSDGTFLANLRVPANRTVHLAVSAVSAAGESARSNLGVCEPGCRRARPTSASRRH